MTIDAIDERYDEDHFTSVAAEDTDAEWSYILELCRRARAIGFGVLDSFLSGPDLERRVTLVENEAATNEWLRLELRDTIELDQSTTWSPAQLERMRAAAYRDARGGPAANVVP